MAVKLEKVLTAREIRGEKKHKILWCFGDLEGVFCGGQCPFSFGLYLGKEEVTGSNPVSSSKKPARFRAGFVMSHELDFHLSLTRFCALRELRTQIKWRKMRYSVASLLTNPVSSSKKPARFRAGFVMSHQHGFSPFANAIFLPHRKFFRRGPRCLPQPKIANFHPGTPNRPA